MMALPPRHRPRVRASSLIEHAIQHAIKRRTVKVRIFPNRGALIHLVSAILFGIDAKSSTTNRV